MWGRVGEERWWSGGRGGGRGTIFDVPVWGEEREWWRECKRRERDRHWVFGELRTWSFNILVHPTVYYSILQYVTVYSIYFLSRRFNPQRATWCMMSLLTTWPRSPSWRCVSLTCTRPSCSTPMVHPRPWRNPSSNGRDTGKACMESFHPYSVGNCQRCHDVFLKFTYQRYPGTEVWETSWGVVWLQHGVSDSYQLLQRTTRQDFWELWRSKNGWRYLSKKKSSHLSLWGILLLCPIVISLYICHVTV